MKILFAYRYGILGGVCTQLRNRVSGFGSVPEVELHFAFMSDHGIAGTLAGERVCFVDSAAALARYCDRERVDVLSVIDTPELLGAARKARTLRRVVLEVHTTYPAGLRSLGGELPGVDAILVPSAYSSRIVSAHLGARFPIHQWSNCVAAATFYPVRRSHVEPPIVLWVGKLDEHKNWRGLVEVGAALALKGMRPELWLVGGATAPNEVKQNLLNESFKAGLGTQLRWLDQVPYGTMARIYQIAAASGGLLLVTSRCESFGMAVAEALMCGCPVVASDVGAIAEVCADRVMLRLYPFGDYQRAAVEVGHVFDVGPTPMGYRDRLHQSLARKLSPEVICKEFLTLVERL